MNVLHINSYSCTYTFLKKKSLKKENKWISLNLLCLWNWHILNNLVRIFLLFGLSSFKLSRLSYWGVKSITANVCFYFLHFIYLNRLYMVLTFLSKWAKWLFSFYFPLVIFLIYFLFKFFHLFYIWPQSI